MPIYKIADLNILINPISQGVEKRLVPYLSDSEIADFEAIISAEEVGANRKQGEMLYSFENTENSLILKEICEKVMACYDGFFFHSSCVAVDGEAYVFTAKSGVGKSTHTALWRKHFGERAVMVNDDKPIMRKIDGRFYVCGTPWMGKSDIGSNIKVPVKAVYILQRSEHNFARRVSTGDVFKQLFEATLIPDSKEKMTVLLELLDEFFSQVPLFLLGCNISDEAVETAYSAVNK